MIEFSSQDGDEDERAPRTTECKFCGKSGLEWTDDNGRWKLIVPHTGELHICKFKNVAKDFEVVK